MNTRTIHTVADLSSFLKEQDQSLPVVLLVRDDFESIIDAASYVCHRIILTPANIQCSKVTELEREVEKLENALEQAEDELKELKTKLQTISECVAGL